MSQSQKEQQELKLIASKRSAIQILKDKYRARQMSLKRDLNRFEAISRLYNSSEYQQLLLSNTELLAQLQNTKNEYEQLPDDRQIKLQKLQLSNEKLQEEVLDLESSIAMQKQRELRIESSLRSCEDAVDKLIFKKASLEKDISTLKHQLSNTQHLKDSLMLQYSELTSLLSEQEVQLLREDRYAELEFMYSRQIKNGNITESNLLIELAEKYLQLQKLQIEHDSTQRAFSHYSNCQSQQDLIAQQSNLDEQFTRISEQINRERELERQILADCEENVKKEAIAQAHQWITHKLQGINKKEKTIAALLQIIVPSENQSLDQVQEIQSELKLIQTQQSKLRAKLEEAI